MGQTVNARNDVALDTIITNVIIIDSISGIIKADIGIKVLYTISKSVSKKNFNLYSIKDGMIHGVGKGGNPHTMQITPGMIVGVGTDVICGEGLICTAGGIDIGAFFTQSKDAFLSALCSGITTIFGIAGFCIRLILYVILLFW